MTRKKTNDELSGVDRLLTAVEVASILHVSRFMIYALIAGRALRLVHIGRSLCFRLGDVQQYVRLGGQELCSSDVARPFKRNAHQTLHWASGALDNWRDLPLILPFQ